MIKKLLFFFAAFLLTTVAQAQDETQEHWWGYVSDETQRTGLGVQAADTYHCAIFIPGNQAVASGKTIKAVRFGLTAAGAEDVKVWLASSLPSKITAANTLQIVNVTTTGQTIDVNLTSPYTIPAGGVYVGYSFTIGKVSTQDDQYPVFTTGSDNSNGLYLKTDQNVPQWSNLYGYGYGSLFLQVLLEGEFVDNTAVPADFGPLYTLLGQPVTDQFAITNVGTTPLSSIDYTITSDGVTSAEQHIDITSPIAFNNTDYLSITVPADTVAHASTKTLNITKVNGVDNAQADQGAKFTLYTLPEKVDRNVVVEEFTGTGCGYCPRGLIGMENLRNTYGDRFIGIGLHQYNSSDAMYINSNAYAKLSFGGAPSCRIDRGEEIDPYYGSGSDIRDDFANEMAVPALAQVSVSGVVDSLMTKVEAKAEVKALIDDSKFTLEFVVVGDSLKGTGTAWNQSNYYYQGTTAQWGVGSDMAIFCKGGKYGKSSVSGWYFNDVALCSSYVSGSNKAPALGTLAGGESKEAEYTLTLPTKTTLKNAMKQDQLYIIALVVDQNKKIVNAAKAKIELEQPEVIDPDTTEVIIPDTLVVNPDDLELEAPEGWVKAIANGNLADSVVTSYAAKEYPSANIVDAVIVPGAGKNYSRGIMVKAGDDTQNEGAQAWDSQFWIKLNQALPTGTKLHVEFDYKASQAAKVTTQSHAAPGSYLHWAMIGDVSFTAEWQHFSTDVEVTDAMAKGDNGNGNGEGVLSIAFNLQEEKSATDYFFDNFGVWYQLPVVDGIQSLKADNAAEAVFNLNGQKVQKARKGLYIQNGKKIVR